MNPAIVVLAAGASERLGTCKALVDLGGQSALQRLLSAACAAGAQEIHVVAGAHAEAIAQELERLGTGPHAKLLRNERWALGRTGSLALAAQHLPGRDLLVAPVDVPLVPAVVFAQIQAAWDTAASPALGWLAPFLEPGRRFGHPLVLGRELAAGLSRMAPDQPLRHLRAAASPLLGLRVFYPEILDDLDTPADLARLQAALRRGRE